MHTRPAAPRTEIRVPLVHAKNDPARAGGAHAAFASNQPIPVGDPVRRSRAAIPLGEGPPATSACGRERVSIRMKILHAFWRPEPGDAFVQAGAFRLWVEVPQRQPASRTQAMAPHPFQLPRDDWPALLDLLGIAGVPPAAIETCPVQLPSAADAPLPSPQLAKYWA